MRVLRSLVVFVSLTGMFGCADMISSPADKDEKNRKSQANRESSAPNNDTGFNSGKGDSYGEDDRLEYYELSDSTLKELTRSTAALIEPSKILDVEDSDPDYDTVKLKEEQAPLCQGEKYEQQRRIANCSGVLVGEDLVATAAHCISENNCSKKFVFDVYYRTEDDAPGLTSRRQIYDCDEVVTYGYYRNEFVEESIDYAVVRLERNVTGREPVPVRRKGEISEDTPVAAIGSPLGLPLKISPNAEVIDNSPKEYFITDLDIFGGNSGGPVFNLNTGKLEGLAVRATGQRESKSGYTIDRANRCVRWSSCTNIEEADLEAGTDCNGNHIQRVTSFSEVIPSDGED